jgi:hypothetical protein
LLFRNPEFSADQLEFSTAASLVERAEFLARHWTAPPLLWHLTDLSSAAFQLLHIGPRLAAILFFQSCRASAPAAALSAPVLGAPTTLFSAQAFAAYAGAAHGRAAMDIAMVRIATDFLMKQFRCAPGF